MKSINFHHNFKIMSLVFKTNMSVLYTRQSLWISLFLFSLVLLIVFPFAFGTDTLKAFNVQIGSYWIIQEFVVFLLVLNMFKFETECGIIELYHSNRASKLALIFGKVFFTWFQILTIQLPFIFFWMIIFNPDLSYLFKLIPNLFLVSILFGFNSSLLGGFLESITQNSRLKEVLYPLLFFPLQSGLLLACVGICLSSQNTQSMIEWSSWWNILFIYSGLFVGLTLLFGDTFLEN